MSGVLPRDDDRISVAGGQSTTSSSTVLPMQVSSVTGRLLVDLPSSGGTPGGLNTQLQYNNNGAFGGITGAVTDGTAVSLTSAHLLNPTINGAGTGLATLAYPNTAANATITLPATTGTVALTSQLTTGTVTTVSVATANGFAGTVANATTTPAITLTTSVNAPVLAGNGTAISAATTSGTGSTVVLTGSPTITSPTVGTQATTDNSTLAASTAYVTTAINNAIAGVNPAVAVQAATTQASDTSGLTYNNGVSGIGATLTGSNNTAVTIDGFTFTTLGQRLLVKNDTQSPSGAFNGVYYVTQVQTAIIPPILTRALDYDTPSDMNNTGAIPVVNGTVNANTSWLLTSTVVTVGTTPLTYVQFSIAPTNVVTLTGTQTLTNKRITKRVSALSANSATPAINTDTTDVVHITAQTTAITSFTSSLSGTPVDGDILRISITGTTAIAITWGTSFEASTQALPTTTVSTSRLDIGFFWNTETSKWRCVASA